MKIRILILLLMINLTAFSQNEKKLQKVDWNGYAQIRALSNFDDYSSFMLRRLKFWLKSTTDFSEHWSYKIQTTITSLKQENFFLQDIKIGYRTKYLSFDFGQFVPAYSLMRFQPDYKLPVIERAKSIDYLIPDGTLGVRDIGLQANLHNLNKTLKTSFGIFNGYGIKEYHFNNQGFMFTNKTTASILTAHNKIEFGYSFQYRKAKNLKIKKVLPDSVSFSGNDIRFNIFARFESKLFEFQAEYLSAKIGEQQANGYYLLSALNIKKSQLIFMFENYNDLISTTDDKPYFHFGYNYSLNNYKLKIFFDNYFQFFENNIKSYFATIQLQIFLKQ